MVRKEKLTEPETENTEKSSPLKKDLMEYVDVKTPDNINNFDIYMTLTI